MFRKQFTQAMAAIMLFIASFVMLAPSPVYAQSAHGQQNAPLSSGKCDGIKDKKLKKQCEKEQNKKDKKGSSDRKGHDGPNHDSTGSNG